MTTTDNLRSGEPAAWLDPAAHLHLLADPTLVAGAAIALVWSAGRGAGMYTVMRERYGAIVAVWWAHATDLPAMAAAVGALADVSAAGVCEMARAMVALLRRRDLCNAYHFDQNDDLLDRIDAWARGELAERPEVYGAHIASSHEQDIGNVLLATERTGAAPRILGRMAETMTRNAMYPPAADLVATLRAAVPSLTDTAERCAPHAR